MTNEIYEILLCDTVHSIFSNKVMREDFTVGSSACVCYGGGGPYFNRFCIF